MKFMTSVKLLKHHEARYTAEIYSNGGFHCIFKSTARGGKMTRVSWIYEEGWRELWSLSHSKAGVPPNQTGPVTHHICPFQHADAHRHMDLLMEGSGFWVRGSAVHRRSSFSDSVNHGSEADGKNKDGSPSESSPDTTAHGKSTFQNVGRLFSVTALRCTARIFLRR